MRRPGLPRRCRARPRPGAGRAPGAPARVARWRRPQRGALGLPPGPCLATRVPSAPAWRRGGTTWGRSRGAWSAPLRRHRCPRPLLRLCNPLLWRGVRGGALLCRSAECQWGPGGRERCKSAVDGREILVPFGANCREQRPAPGVIGRMLLMSQPTTYRDVPYLDPRLLEGGRSAAHSRLRHTAPEQRTPAAMGDSKGRSSPKPGNEALEARRALLLVKPSKLTPRAALPSALHLVCVCPSAADPP
jgi:hypothetical protein